MPISVLIKPVSGACNQHCDYCFYADEARSRATANYGRMTQETLQKVIRRTLLPARGYASYLFQGGEPTLAGLEFYQQVIAYQKKYNKNGVQIYNALQTNGYEIDEEWCRFFRQEDFLIGLSVDGLREQHERYRHAPAAGGSYDRAIRAAELMDRYEVPYNILTVVTPAVAEQIPEIYADYRRRGWLRQQYIPCIDPFGGRADYSPDAESYGNFLIRLFELWYEDCRQKRAPYIREFDNMIRILGGYLPEDCAMRGVCGLQNVVEADGSVYPCDFYVLDEYRMGSLAEQTLEQLHASPAAQKFIKGSRLPEACSCCAYFRLCRGGCRRYRITDGAMKTQNRFCAGYRMFYDACLDRLKELAERMN